MNKSNPAAKIAALMARKQGVPVEKTAKMMAKHANSKAKKAC